MSGLLRPPDMEALWTPQPPGFDPARSAESAKSAVVIGLDPDLTRSRPHSLGLCKQEVTGSIPVGSMPDLQVLELRLIPADCRAPVPSGSPWTNAFSRFRSSVSLFMARA